MLFIILTMLASIFPTKIALVKHKKPSSLSGQLSVSQVTMCLVYLYMILGLLMTLKRITTLHNKHCATTDFILYNSGP